MSSNDSSFVGRYENLGGGTTGGTPNDAPYTGGPYGAARPAQSSPPASQHPSSSTDMSRPSVGGSSVNGNRPPSSASSIGMSSDGRMGMGRPPPGDRDSSRSHFKDDSEAALQRHYTALKSYLQVHLQDEKGNIKPNRARDKLLRLSVTQFMELSTDVYDELIRREDERMQRVENVPRFLLPKQNFHPKRNQARQKLSTLPIERFRQLATDVFYELERRIPRIVAGDMGRPRSTTSNASGRSRAPSRGGMRPPGPGYGYPPGPGRGRGYPPGPYGPGPGMPPGPRRPSEAGSLGRPLPKHLQSNTIVPNKGTMVEDDEMDDDEDAFGLDHVGTGLSARSPVEGSAEDKEKIQAQEAELAELKEKLEAKESEWTSLREELEQKHENLQQELAAFQAKSRDEDEIREQHDHNMQALRDQLEDLHAENENLRSQSSNPGDVKLLHAQLETHQAENEGLKRQLQDQATPAEFEQRIQELEAELATQQKISEEVRQEATMYLREMRDLSRQNDEAIDKEEEMRAKIKKLEEEAEQWRVRCAKVRAQNKQLRASTMGLGLQTGFDSGSLVRQEGLISEGGLVRDTDVTRFQLAVDELLRVARQTSTDDMLESVKSVVISVQSITTAVRTEGYPTPSPSPLSPETNMQQAPNVNKIKARVTGTANSLITATKQHAASHGLSPVALLDAAASNLTAAVVELIKAVHIRPSNKTDFQDLDGVDELNSFYDDTASPSTSTNPNGLQIPVPTFNAPVAPPAEPKAVDPATLPVRKASMKKPNGGWFGWAGKWNDDSAEAGPPAAPPVTNGHAQQQHLDDDSDGEYDPYR
ncbi:hypothetical protein PRZ48_005477 [Zasmidium cellare]|uniref:GIT Spa2 homology (SHD) domain-containing protein n=1 Tax=Zasmidium cellare TaxID=395010 RepID=A0ABR0ETZ0_ZASCE|nr:hypothetical protein PRZ48_005477 [Zasmidium cellare]